MRCQNPMCSLSPEHRPPCDTTDGPQYLSASCADVVAVETPLETVQRLQRELELKELRLRLRVHPCDERINAEIAILENQLQAARGAKGASRCVTR